MCSLPIFVGLHVSVQESPRSLLEWRNPQKKNKLNFKHTSLARTCCRLPNAAPGMSPMALGKRARYLAAATSMLLAWHVSFGAAGRSMKVALSSDCTPLEVGQRPPAAHLPGALQQQAPHMPVCVAAAGSSGVGRLSGRYTGGGQTASPAIVTAQPWTATVLVPPHALLLSFTTHPGRGATAV